MRFVDKNQHASLKLIGMLKYMRKLQLPEKSRVHQFTNLETTLLPTEILQIRYKCKFQPRKNIMFPFLKMLEHAGTAENHGQGNTSVKLAKHYTFHKNSMRMRTITIQTITMVLKKLIIQLQTLQTKRITVITR